MIFDSESILKKYYSYEGQELHDMGSAHAAVLLLIDTSASMAGEKICAVEHAINGFIDELKGSYEAECTDICIVSFSDETKIVQPFTCASNLAEIALEASGLTSLWEALSISIDLLNNQRQLYKELAITYYKPRIFLITYGTPTDFGDIVIPKLKSDIANRRYGLCVLGLPGYDENLFTFLEVPHGLVQCEEVQDYLNKIISRH
jgi:von willebrand factor, type A